MKGRSEMCNDESDSAVRRPQGYHCNLSADWLRQLGMGQHQSRWVRPEDKGQPPEELHPVHYEKPGVVIRSLVRSRRLGEANDIHGFTKGMRR